MTRKSTTYLCSLFLATALASVPAAAKVSERSLQLHEEARTLLQKGDAKAAEIQLKNAIQSDPDNVEARFDLAGIYLQTRQAAAAEKELRQAQQRGMDRARVLVPLGQALAMQNKFRELLQALTVDDLSPEIKADVLVLRGGAYAGLRDMDQAVAVLREAEDIAPDNHRVYEALSQVLQARGDFAEAEGKIDRALELKPDSTNALIRKGGLRQAQYDPPKAIEYYSAALEHEPANIVARVARATAYVSIGQDQDASSDVEYVLDRVPTSPMATYLKALLLSRERKYDEAMELMQRVHVPLAQYPPAVFLLGTLSFARGNMEQAQTHLQEYLVLSPGNERGERLLAAVHLRKNQPERAIALLEPLQRKHPEDERVATLLGSAYMAARRYEEASTMFERAVAADPDDTAALTRLAVGRLSAGESDRAVEDLEAIIQREPDGLRANVLLILTHLRARDYDKSFAAAERLRERMPDNPLPQNFLGTIELARGNLDASRAHFEQALTLKPDFAPAALNLAELDRRSGNAAEARARYEKILADDPKNVQAPMRLAQMDFGEGRPEQGLAWLDMAIARDPTARAPRLAKVNALIEMKQPGQAVTAARELLQVADRHPDALDALARAQGAAGDTANAIGTYRQLAALVPDSATVHYRLGRALAAGKNFGQAAASLDRALALDPTQVAALRDRVRVERELNGAPAALRLAQSMVSTSPQKAAAQSVVGDLLSAEGRHEEAAVAYAASLEAEPSSATLDRYYRSLDRAGRPAEGREALEAWLNDRPDDASIRFLYASALIRDGEFDGAIAQNEQLLERFPRNPALLNDLAWLYEQTGRPKALPYAERAYEMAPDSPAIADTLGWILLARGETDRALGLLKKAHEGAPEHAEIGYHYAVALKKAGQTDAAVAKLKSVLDTGRSFHGIEAARTLYAELVKR